MTEPKPGFVAPDPRRIATRRDFGVELTLARRRRGLSIRSVARAIGVPVSTVGGYFAGSHLPALHPPDLLSQLLRVLGIDDEDEITLWWQAYWRVRGPVGEQSGSAPVDGGSPLAQVSVSIEAPIERLMVEPVLRGREVELKSLCDLVAQANQMHPEPRVRVLYGLGGSGKSTLALAVAQCARACGIRTFWVASDDRATTAAGMRALAVEIRVPVERLRAGSLPDAVWQRLRDLPEPWLLVFDNADNPLESLALPGQRVTDGTGWLRPVGTGLGTVIVTTRDGHRATWGDPAPSWLALHRLTGLADAHGAQVLMELAGESAGTVEEARVLSRRLGGLPLALMLAGRYLAEAGRTPPELALPRTYREYLAALETGDYADLFPAESEPARRAIGPTWDLSLDLVAGRAGGHAQSLLRLIAALGPGPIPHRELLDVRIMRDTPIFAGITPRLLWEALRALEALGMITIFSRAFPGERTSRVYIDIHPLVRHVTRHDRQMGEHLAEYAATATRLLHAAVHDHEPKSPSTWRLWHLMVGHCVAVLDLVADHKVDLAVVRAAVERACEAAQYLRAAGLYDQADATFQRTLDACQRRLPEDDPVSLLLRHEFARLRYDQGLLGEAESEYRQVLSMRRRSLGENHPDSLATQYYLARTLRRRAVEQATGVEASLSEAERLLQRTYEARLRLLGPDHPDTLTSRHGVADLLRARGDLEQALAVYGEVLAARRRVLGGRHPATLVTQQRRAEVLWRLERTAEAETELRWLRRVNREVRGQDHPRTLATDQHLVALLHERGRLSEAKELVRVVLASLRRSLGNTHPTTMAVRHRLGLIYLDQGDLDAAQRELASVHVDRSITLGVDHPDTQQTNEILVAIQRRMDTTTNGSD